MALPFKKLYEWLPRITWFQAIFSVHVNWLWFQFYSWHNMVAHVARFSRQYIGVIELNNMVLGEAVFSYRRFFRLCQPYVSSLLADFMTCCNPIISSRLTVSTLSPVILASLLFSSSLRMGSKRYPEMSHTSYNIMMCHNPKELHHQFHCGKSLRTHK